MLGVSTSVYASLMGTGFSPAYIFTSGTQGVWYEPSDLTTMFQDRAGTTPVTTPGQTVGLRLDKSKGLVLGSELVTNGDFSGGSTGWLITASGTNTITISSGSVRFVTNGSADAATLGQPWSGATAVGKYYRITFDVLSGSTGQLKITTLGVSTVIGEHTFTATPGTKSFTLVSSNAINIGISRIVGQSADATIDNISVKELAGNHAVAPTDAARPTYGIEPKTGRRNLLGNMTQADTGWVTAGTTPPTLAMSQTYLGESCTAVTFTSVMTATYAGTRALQSGTSGTLGASVVVGNTYRTSYHLSLSRALVGAEQIALYFTGTTGLTEMLLTAANTASLVGVFERRSNTASSSLGSNGTVFPYVYLKGAMSSDVTLYINKIQIENGSTATNYQSVGTAFDVTEAGVATVHYVQYDGTDDSFSTSSIDFSATDKMSVFAGVRKLSDASGILIEHSPISTNNGTFFILTSYGGTNLANYGWRSRGTLTSDVSSTVLTAPVTNVVTGLGDISGDTSTLRINGAQTAQSITDQGTGNYGNYQLFIGRRNNTSLPFNGRDYGIIIVGKAASAGEIYSTESYLAANTSEVSV